MVSGARPRPLVHCRAEVGDSPVYDPAADTLYWLDAPRGHLWRWDRLQGAVAVQEIGEPVGSVAVIDGGGFLLAARRGLLVLSQWNDLPHLWQPVEEDIASQFNDGKCDPQGRFVAGTSMHDPRFTGTLYRIDHDGAAHPLVRGIGLSNGLDWSPDRRFFYHVDTIAQTVSRYRWDDETGVPHDPAPFIEIPPGQGLPDGLAVDRAGCVWLAVSGAGEVRRYDPEGRLLGAIALPTPNVSDCAFGGPLLNELYITTSAHAAPAHGEAARLAGNVFVMTTPIQGQPRRPFPRHALPPELLAPQASAP